MSQLSQLSPSQAKHVLEEAGQALLTQGLGVVVPVTILFYDYFLTLPDEIEHVWSQPISLASALFYINRYTPMPILLLVLYDISRLHGHLSSQFCDFIFLLQPITETVSYIAASSILLFRVLALYQGNHIVYLVSILTFGATHAVAVALVAKVLVEAWSSLRYSVFLNVCIGRNGAGLAGVYFSLIPFEVILVALQLNHCIRHRHLLKRSGDPKSSLLTTIYIDGLVYFAVVLILRLTAGLIFVWKRTSLFYLVTSTEFAFNSLIVSRLFLHLRHMGQEPENDSDTYSVSTLVPSNPGNLISALGKYTESLPRKGATDGKSGTP